MESCQKMKTVIESTLKSHDLLDRFKASQSFYALFENFDNGLPLEVAKEYGKTVRVSRPILESEIGLCDPEMEFSIHSDEWHAFSHYNRYGDYTAVFYELSNGAVIHCQETRKHLLSLAECMAEEIADQGFGKVLKIREG